MSRGSEQEPGRIPGGDATRAGRRFTLIAFHAHPDDESLLTGGTLARAAEEGHRVVLVTATDGELGLAGEADGHGAVLAGVRSRELADAAAALGVARVVRLGYADSGMHAESEGPDAFARADAEEAAERLAEVLREESADVLTVYDPRGGYGHPDHVQVHRVGTRAARLAGTPVVLEATVPGTLFRLALRVAALARHPLAGAAPLGTTDVFSSPRAITHRVRVRGTALQAKRAGLAAHASQRRGGGSPRMLDRALGLPLPVFGLVLGQEWFVEQGAEHHHRRSRKDDVFATLRHP